MGILNDLREKVEMKLEETNTPPSSPVTEIPQEDNTSIVDRAVYNCPTCKGEGLTEDQTARCATCKGTGKV